MLTGPQFSPDKLAEVRRRIEAAARVAGRDPSVVRLLAVSKQQPAAAIRAAVGAGQLEFGENYLQEALPKIRELAALPIVWHFIGQLQGNKTRAVAENFAWVHTLDRERIARRLSAQRAHHAPPLEVLIQVRLDEEPDKGGVEPQELPRLAEIVAGLPRLRLRGLMCIPAPPGDAQPGAQRIPFARLRALLADLNDRGHQLDTLSMGMSADLEAAVAEGATIVRVGTALFGPRD
jgi:pyridoxal phosphate enzyme (YggS family)